MRPALSIRKSTGCLRGATGRCAGRPTASLAAGPRDYRGPVVDLALERCGPRCRSGRVPVVCVERLVAAPDGRRRALQPVHVTTVARSLILLWNDAARVVDPEEYRLFAWSDWSLRRTADGEPCIRST